MKLQDDPTISLTFIYTQRPKTTHTHKMYTQKKILYIQINVTTCTQDLHKSCQQTKIED